MDEINELRELVGPGFHVDISARSFALVGKPHEFELTVIHSGGTYTQVTRAFGDLYEKLMTHERWTTQGDPDVRVRFVEVERGLWQLGGTLVKRPTHFARGEGTIALVRTSRDGHE